MKKNEGMIAYWPFEKDTEERTGYEREIMALAMYNGKIYAGSLPMANVWRLDAKEFTFVGNLDNTDSVYEGPRLKLHVDGRLVATSSAFNPADYDLSNNQPLRIGFGIGANFHGAMRDLRIYSRALTLQEVSRLFNRDFAATS
jgi:hypothetical protein